jgi:hypothetical protein
MEYAENVKARMVRRMSAQAPDGRRYLTGFRLQVGGAALGEVPAIR